MLFRSLAKSKDLEDLQVARTSERAGRRQLILHVITWWSESVSGNTSTS